ncbi:MAG: hypothetical protein JWO47_685 [Candidatus Saccharibacteria bacterium]|nr:hypothetical protein [Candidatus Saccharibacteria bacterium]
MPGYTEKGPSSMSSGNQVQSVLPMNIEKWNLTISNHIGHPSNDGYPALGVQGEIVWFDYTGMQIPPLYNPYTTQASAPTTANRLSRRVESSSSRVTALDLSPQQICEQACSSNRRSGYRCDGAQLDKDFGDFKCSVTGDYESLPVSLRFR